jgi:DMSO/TMAO reductase YedYZ molybdopterin-dependent catalytic subunit
MSEDPSEPGSGGDGTGEAAPPDGGTDDAPGGGPDGATTSDGGSGEDPEDDPAVAPATDPLREMDADDGGDGDGGGGDGDAGDGSATPLRSPSRLVVAFLAGIGGLAGSYAAAGASTGYLLGPFADLLADYTPAIVFQFFRNELGSTLQKLLAGSMAAAFLGLGVVAALYVADRTDRSWAAVPMAGVLAAGLAFVATGTAPPAAAAGVAVAVVVGVAEFGATAPVGGSPDPGRRRVLAGVATAVGVGLLGRAAGNRLGNRFAGTSPSGGEDGDPTLVDVDQDEIRTLLDEAREKSFDVPDIEPLVSRNFYAVDINAVDPEVDVEEWSLSVTGEVEREVTYDYADIRNMEYENRFVSLRCVSDSINGGALDNALWTGVPASRILEEASPQGNYVLLKAVDGYEVGFPLAALEAGMFAYGMNGKVLPEAHGYPLRALVPGHWGETNTKWIDEIEITEEVVDGYWESRGWAGTGPVHTVAKLKSVRRPEDGRIEVAGPAYAGLRGVSAVEVSTDGGETWSRAELTEPLPGEDVWRQWRHEYDSPGEDHEVVVRAVEADGTVQPEEKTDDAFPSGATGWVSRTVEA